MPVTKHTPGPWKPACGARGTTCRHPAILCDGGQVGNATWQGSEAATDANARLIAAAPDLLMFAQDVADGVIVPELMTHEGLIEVLLRWQKAARAAIAKATGGAPCL